MAHEILEASSGQAAPVRYLLEVVEEGDHWASTLFRLDANGEPEGTAVAPRFYGLTAQQARRRMITILEGQYEQVQTVSRE